MATKSDAVIQSTPIPPSLIPLFLRNKLHPLLPYSLPLYRRCQFFLNRITSRSLTTQTPLLSSNSSDHNKPGEEEVWVAITTSLSQSEPESDDWLTTWLNTSEPQLQTELNGGNTSSATTRHQLPWLATIIDIKEPGQTQVWVFGSWEPSFPPPTTSSPSHDDTSPTPTRLQINLGRTLIHHLRTQHIPSLPTTPTPQFQRLVDDGKIITQPYLRSRVLFGTVAEASWWLLSDHVVKNKEPNDNTRDGNGDGSTPHPDPNFSLKTSTAVTRIDWSYYKYLLCLPLPDPTPSSSTTSQTGPFIATTPGPLKTTHLQTMLDRTAIPRTLETLQSLTSIGLFLTPTNPSEDVSSHLVAWGMIGKDASVSSLHTEDAYRGRGLAVTVVRELVKAQRDVFGTRTDLRGERMSGGDGVEEWQDEVPWAHTDVSEKNVPSRRVFEKMGGEVGWRVAWIEVDVGEV